MYNVHVGVHVHVHCIYMYIGTLYTCSAIGLGRLENVFPSGLRESFHYLGV